MIKTFFSDREKHRYYNSLSEKQKYNAFRDAEGIRAEKECNASADLPCMDAPCGAVDHDAFL